jgi:hypothetical protein
MPAKRPNQESTLRPRNEAARRALASRARYVGSDEHKTERWWGGLPARYSKKRKPARYKKQKTTICPLTTEAERDIATGWVQAAIRAGHYEFFEGDQEFPKHLWHEIDGRRWFGFCINSAAGEYKGWPLEEDEPRAFFD